jgi:hypothetical protein
MKNLAATYFLVVITLAGCRKQVGPVAAQHDSIQAFLDPAFVRTSIPKERDEDFRQIVTAFAEGRFESERVRSVTFKSPSEVEIAFSDGGMHGGGAATAKKDGARWRITEKFWFL